MSILKEADFYYGAVLSTLINRGICPALVESGIVDFTDDGLCCLDKRSRGYRD